MEWSNNLQLYPKYLRRRIERGCGLGKGTSYKPWLKVADVPSQGTSASIAGIRTKRVHHLLSELETTYFMLVERESDVVDIREQFPILSIQETLDLCSACSANHPYKKEYPEPFTIDLLITRKTPGGLVHQARSVKPPRHLINEATQRRLEVEWKWCQKHGIDWRLVDTSGFSKELLSSLRFMRGWVRYGQTLDFETAVDNSRVFRDEFRPHDALSVILKRVSRHLAQRDVVTTNLFRAAAWHGLIELDYTKQIAMNRPVALRN